MFLWLNVRMRPEYVDLSNKERNAVLSQNGNFSSTEREIFQWLCNNYVEQISYENVLDAIFNKFPNAKNTLRLLISKLQQSGIAVLRTETKLNNQTPSYIILTNKYDEKFCNQLVEELTLEATINPETPLPLISELRKSNYSDMIYNIPEISLQELDIIYEETSVPDTVSLMVFEKEGLCISTKNLPLLVDALILKIRYFFSSADFLADVAKATETTFTNIQEKIKSTDVRNWHDLTTALVKHRESIFANTRLDTSKEILIYAVILSKVSGRIIQEDHEEQQAHLVKQELLDDLLQTMKDHPTNIVTKEEFSNMLAPIQQSLGDDFSKFIADFEATYVKPINTPVTPTIVLLELGYVHINKFFSYFYDEFIRLKVYLKDWVAQEVLDSLRSSTTHPLMLSYQSYVQTITKEVTKKSPFVSTILKHPRLLADSVLIHGRETLKSDSIKTMEKLLGIFFYKETMELKEYEKIFDLNIGGIVRNACKRMPLFTRIWWTITGKTKQIIERYRNDFRGKEFDENAGSEWSKDNMVDGIGNTRIMINKTKKSEALTNKESLSQRRKKNAEVKQEAIEKGREMSNKNQNVDQLWKDFRKAIKRD